MAIERCGTCGKPWDRDWHTECPRCPPQQLDAILSSIGADIDRFLAAMKAPIQIKDEPADLIRILKDETNDRSVFERCKRVLGEA